MIDSIINRRSIRKYLDNHIPKEHIQKVIRSGMLAPSSKNRQPWHFTVVSARAKKEMLTVMEQGLKREQTTSALLPGSSRFLKGAEYTLDIMTQAPVTIFVTNTLGLDLNKKLSPEERIYEICNAQSIGAALENMTLTATDLGLGSLWICDIFFAYQELNNWLNKEGTLVAAMTLGYADEAPKTRPRKKFDEIVEWRL